MKRLFILVFLLKIMTAHAQEPMQQNYIEVTGIAEQEVTPDEIYLSITLREFDKDKRRTTINELETSLKKILSELQIETASLSVENVYGHEYKMRRKEEVFYASKRYALKLPDLQKVNMLTEKLDAIGVKEVNVERAEYSREGEVKLQVRKEALKAAKNKAQAMLNAIGENVGKPIYVRENEYYGGPRISNTMLKAYDDNGGTSDVSFRKIKIVGNVTARFEILK